MTPSDFSTVRTMEELLAAIQRDFPHPHTWSIGMCDCGKYRARMDGPSTSIILLTASGPINALAK